MLYEIYQIYVYLHNGLFLSFPTIKYKYIYYTKGLNEIPLK